MLSVPNEHLQHTAYLKCFIPYRRSQRAKAPAKATVATQVRAKAKTVVAQAARKNVRKHVVSINA